MKRTYLRPQTASLLTFAIYMLTQHPHVARRLREEIVTKVGNSRPTFEQVKNMKYLRAVIHGMFYYLSSLASSMTSIAAIETLRLYPPV
jgi:cytochrome P450